MSFPELGQVDTLAQTPRIQCEWNDGKGGLIWNETEGRLLHEQTY